MKTICFLFLVSFAATALAKTQEIDKKGKAAFTKCKDEPPQNIDKKEDCFAACFMKEMGFMTNGQINIKGLEEADKQKWEDKELIELGINVDNRCAKEVGETRGRSECAIAYEFGKCKTRLMRETGLSPPTPIK